MKVFGYARVSSEMQMEGFSIAAQERAIRTYCEMQGWNLQHLYIDEGRSARSDDLSKRPAFAQMLADAEESSIDVIVVHKLDRFARNIVTTLTTLQRLEKAGIGFVSINENMDFTSPIGKAMLAMLAAFAQFYSDNLSTETKKGKAERKKQGLHNGPLPFGVALDSRGIPIPDTEAWASSRSNKSPIIPYEGLKLAFELSAAGTSDREIARALNRRGHMSSGHMGRNPMSKDSVRVILRNRFYLGELPDDEGGWIPGQHKPMIDEAVFAQAQEQRARRAVGRSGSNVPRRVTPFTGILVCAECGSPMRVQSSVYYRCSRTLQTKECNEPGVSLDSLSSQILNVLNTWDFNDDELPFVERVIREWATEHAPTTESRANASERLRRLKELFLDGGITLDQYREESQRLESMAEASKVYEVATTAEQVSGVLQMLSRLGNTWLQQTPEEQNELMSELFSVIYVKNKQVVALLPRPEVAVVLAPIFGVRPRIGGSDGHPLSGCAIEHGAIFLPDTYVHRSSRYSVPRHRKLTNAQIMLIRMDESSTLRDLAEKYGVSHETIRIYRQQGC